MKRPQFSYTRNFFLKLDMSRPAFKAQALYAADAVAAAPALPAAVKTKATAVRTAALAFNEKLVESTKPNEAEVFGEVREEADQLLRLLLRRCISPRYETGSTGYDRFLPAGLEEYNNAEEQDYEVLFERFVKAVEAEAKPFVDPEAAPGDPTPAQQARQMLTRLQGATKTDAEYTSGNETLRRALSADWKTVAIAEWRLWLALHDHFAEAEDYRERVYAYFDFSEIESQGREEDEDDDTPTPPAG